MSKKLVKIERRVEIIEGSCNGNLQTNINSFLRGFDRNKDITVNNILWKDDATMILYEEKVYEDDINMPASFDSIPGYDLSKENI